MEVSEETIQHICESLAKASYSMSKYGIEPRLVEHMMKSLNMIDDLYQEQMIESEKGEPND